MPTIEERIEALRAELEASDESGRRAVVQYEIGHLAQHGLKDEAQAVRDYLQAYNHDPQFRPPLMALVSLFERRRSAKNLIRLYDAAARSATNAREAASALADRAVLRVEQPAEGADARTLLETALEQAAEASDIALLLENELLELGEQEAAIETIGRRAELVRDPLLATLLRLEVADARASAGETDEALRLLQNALQNAAPGPNGDETARWHTLRAIERMTRSAGPPAALAAALAAMAKISGAGAAPAVGAGSGDAAKDEAAARYREAGQIQAHLLGDASAARVSYDHALELRAGDPLLRYERMLACELAGDAEEAAAEAARFLGDGAEGALAASLHFRLAEHHQRLGQTESAIDALRSALAADAHATAAAAMLDDLLRATGDTRSTHAALLDEAGRTEGAARAEAFYEAGNLAAYELGDAAAARLGHQAAAEASEHPTPILREGLLAALRVGDAEGASYFVTALLGEDLDPGERSALLRDAHELARLVLEDEEATKRSLITALESEAARAWAPDLARIGAAVEGDSALLARAHTVLAERAVDDETTAAHHCAAARAQARSGDDDAAVVSLRAALEKSPTHPYAIALLEEVLRARGDAEEVVRLLKTAAEQSDAPRAAETRLLLAGAAAEAADDVERAAQTYEEAAERNPFSLAPALALKRLGEVHHDQALLLRALEALSQREIAAGEPGRHTLALGEHYDLVSGKPELAEAPLRAALEGDMALTAAVDLALVPIEHGDATRLLGLERLLVDAGPEVTPGMLREAAGTALTVGDHDKARSLLERLTAVAPRDRWAPMAWLRLSAAVPADRSGRAEAWTALGRATTDPEVAAELINHGLRTQVLGRGRDAIDDAVIIAHEVLAVAPGSLHAAIALDEALSAGDDPDGRAEALGAWREQAGPAGRASLALAHGRALASAGRPREGLEALLLVAATDPDDLASWEAIRVCARDCEAWAPLVEACDRMAHLVDDDELTMLLTEESAAVLMDELEQDDRAERRLRRVLAIDPARPIAYGRLHDLLAEREDDRGLLGLVTARIALVDDVGELSKLYYEQARLHRAADQRDEALNALDNLLMLEDGHVGGLALLVELQVQNENWSGAVDALRSLAAADDVPGAQRRIARLGAADFLDGKLDDPLGALGELTALHASGLADLEIYRRAVTLAERAGVYDQAVEMLDHAIPLAATPASASAMERRAAEIHRDHRRDPPAAVAAFRRALSLAPVDIEVAEALAAALEPDERVALSQAFERDVRVALSASPLDARLLRALARAGAWRGDTALQDAVLGVLVGAGLGTAEETQTFGANPPLATPRGVLDAGGLSALETPGLRGPVFQFATAVSESTAEMDGLEPSGFGLGRGDLQRSDSPLRDELRRLGAVFGLGAAELYTGGDEPARIDIAPDYKGKLTWVTGERVAAPLSPDQRFTIGWLAMGARLGVAPFVRRGPMGGAIALFAAAEAAEAALPAGQGRASMADTKRRLYRAMPRRVRKSLPELLRQLGDDGRSVDAWTAELGRTAQRAGLLVCNDPETALRRVLGGQIDAARVAASPDALDLIAFWLSPECITLRQQLGLVS